MIKLFLLVLLVSTIGAKAQELPRPPDPLDRPAAPATTQAPDGVRNGTTKQERDQHVEPGAPSQTPPAPTLPTPGSPPR